MNTLLIVDDEVKLCAFLARFFELRGFRTLTVHSGQEALEALRAQTPDCLLLDIRMPDLSGLDVLKVAKERNPHLNVVIVSALSDPETIKTAFQLGANDYIQKPFDLNDQAWARAFFAAHE